jgi:hypothetical protein
MNQQTKRATGRIRVTSYDPRPYDEGGGASISEIHVVEEFIGDIAGVGMARFLMVSRSDGYSSFAGVERFQGTLEGRSGSFVLQSAGTLEGGTLEGTWFVVPGTATGELLGLRGEGGFQTAIGIFLDYWFE